MKESIEELVRLYDDCIITKEEFQEKLTSRFAELEAENNKHKNAFAILWNFYKELDKERISYKEQIIELEKKVDALKCCGNCKLYVSGRGGMDEHFTQFCTYDYVYHDANHICPSWQSGKEDRG